MHFSNQQQAWIYWDLRTEPEMFLTNALSGMFTARFKHCFYTWYSASDQILWSPANSGSPQFPPFPKLLFPTEVTSGTGQKEISTHFYSTALHHCDSNQ